MKYIKCFENFQVINEVRVPREERVQLYNDDNIIVVVPLTHRALRKYAHKCLWCINDDERDWEDYHQGKHAIIIQRNPKRDKIGITGRETDEEIFLINKFDNDESTFDDICQMLEYDFSDEKEMVDYYVNITKDINNFSTNIVYYSPESGVYDMGDNNLSNFNLGITDIPNVTPEVIKIIDDYIYKKVIMKYLKELKEFRYLKPKHPYGSKSISLSKIELGDICQKLNIDINKVKFLSSGSYGNAYSFDNKVLKVTTDKREAKMASDLIKNANISVVKYYNVFRYQSKGLMLWVIIMDRVEVLNDFIDKMKYDQGYKSLVDLATDIIFYNWGSLEKEEYINGIEEEYNLDKPFSKKLVTQIWNCYFNLKDLPKLDFHNYNLGYNSDGELVLFDATPIKSRVNRFDEPNII
jgi:hypothetical protein